MNSVERITASGRTLAIIVRSEFREFGIHFFTPDTFSQQLGFMRHEKGKVIEPHRHKPVKREITATQEVLIIKKGRLRVDFYSEAEEFLESRELFQGDILLLVEGGHGFEVLEEIEMVEVKQGPYAGMEDKVRFSGRRQ